jgi:hypothetical protein
MRVYKPWKQKNVEEKTSSAMFWFRILVVISVAQSILTILKLLFLSAVGI